MVPLPEVNARHTDLSDLNARLNLDYIRKKDEVEQMFVFPAIISVYPLGYKIVSSNYDDLI